MSGDMPPNAIFNDHFGWSLNRFETCIRCGGDKRELSGHPNDPHPRDCGPCLACLGEGVIEVETEPCDLEDTYG